MQGNTQTNATTLAIENEIDTNAEYINAGAAEKQPPVLSSVFKYIFVETPKDFFGSITGFFSRFFRHFLDEFKFFASPTLKKAPFNTKDYKEDCQYTFGLAMVITVAIIFLVKMDWIPKDEELATVYGNDITQLFMELMIFLIFAVAYLVMISISVLTGRLFRVMFSIPVTRQESDILFTYLNNSFFSIATICAFFARCVVRYEEGANMENNVFAFYFFVVAGLLIYWSFRFTALNKISLARRIIFQVLAIAFLTIFYGLACSAVTLFLLGA